MLLAFIHSLLYLKIRCLKHRFRSPHRFLVTPAYSELRRASLLAGAAVCPAGSDVRNSTLVLGSASPPRRAGGFCCPPFSPRLQLFDLPQIIRVVALDGGEIPWAKPRWGASSFLAGLCTWPASLPSALLWGIALNEQKGTAPPTRFLVAPYPLGATGINLIP